MDTRDIRLTRVIFIRDFKSQFRRTILGPLLAFISPVVYLMVFIFFRLMFGLPQADGVPMLPFLFSGIMLWMFFSSIVSGVFPSISSNLGILRKMPANPMVFALSSLGMPLLTVSVYSVLMVLMCLYYGIMPKASWIVLPLLILLIGLFGMGIGVFVSGIAIYRRDIIVLLPIILQLGMFVTPIFFSPELVPPQFRWAIAVNPMAHFVNMFRGAMFLGQFPGLMPLCISVFMTGVVWLLGYPLFRRTMRYAADVI